MDTRHPIRHLPRPWSSTRSGPRLAAAALVSVILVMLVTSSLPWSSGTASAHLGTSRWELHDRAVYVVSTMNLVHCRDGRLLSSILIHQDLVTHYDLYADKQVDNL
jgi:hypothetical protein